MRTQEADSFRSRAEGMGGCVKSKVDGHSRTHDTVRVEIVYLVLCRILRGIESQQRDK